MRFFVMMISVFDNWPDAAQSCVVYKRLVSVRGKQHHIIQ